MIGEVVIQYGGYMPKLKFVKYDYNLTVENLDGSSYVVLDNGEKVDKDELCRNRDELYRLQKDEKLIFKKKFFCDYRMEKYVEKVLRWYNNRDDLFISFFPTSLD